MAEKSIGTLTGELTGEMSAAPTGTGQRTGQRINRLKKAQAVSGLVFATFLVLHLLNTWLAALGPAAYDGAQQVLRIVYQAFAVEAVVLAGLIVHIGAGVARIIIEPKRTLSLRARAHRYAGFFLMVVIGGHILAVRGPSWFFDVYPGFAGLAFSIAAVPGYFYPYYFLLALAGFYHGLNGVSIAAARLGWPVRVPSNVLRQVTIAAGVLTAFALMGFGGLFFEVGDVYASPFAKLAMEITGVTFTP